MSSGITDIFFLYNELDILDYSTKTPIYYSENDKLDKIFKKVKTPWKSLQGLRLQDVQCLILQPLNSPVSILNVSPTANKPLENFQDYCIFLLNVIFKKQNLKGKKKKKAASVTLLLCWSHTLVTSRKLLAVVETSQF